MHNFHSYSAEQTSKHLKSNLTKGLCQSARAELLDTNGPNLLPEAHTKSILGRFFSQFKDFMIVILLLAAALSFAASCLEGKPDIFEPGIIIFILVINALLGTLQEVKAQKALDALKKRQSGHVTVIIDGMPVKTSCETLVPGDIIEIRQGLIVPADARLISSTSLIADESALTGESLPVAKNPSLVLPCDTPLGDRKNMIYSSTIISSGHGRAIVTATGEATEIGHIAKILENDSAPETPLTKRMNSISKLLGISCLLICGVIFLIGIYRKTPLITMFLTSISLAVASIPEGLPAVVTIMLSIGVMRLAKHRAIMRNLASVETLGKTAVICSDKTGTLTLNKMTLISFANLNGCHKFSINPIKQINENYELFSAARINTTATKTDGDATEKAILEATNCMELPSYEKIGEIPFNSKRKTMVTICRSGNKITIYVKGAWDRLSSCCTHISHSSQKPCGDNNISSPITPYHYSFISRCHDNFASEALRVLAVARKELTLSEYQSICSCTPSDAGSEDVLYKKLVCGLTFLGLLAFLDPPRPEVKAAIAKAKRAGIKTVMITGDHVNTAKAIADKIGIPSEKALSGEELDALSDAELSHYINSVHIYARVSPTHKVRLVKAFQSKGMRVVMTGDGINDAPALKVADIGAAMGITGTDVAKEASDMILTDDNYATIVEAIAGGRGIYDNIKKSIHFLLSCNTGEILTVLFALLFGLNAPLAAIQLLWINFITDSLPAIAIGMEKPNSDVLSKPSYYQNDGMFDLPMVIKIFLEGALMAAMSLIAYLCYGSTGCFIVLGMSELLHSFNIRSSKSVFLHKQNNPYIIGAFILCSFLQLSVVFVPSIAKAFSLTPVGMNALLVMLAMCCTIILVSELEKFFLKYEITK